MIIDLSRFVAAERASWAELEKRLDVIQSDNRALSFEDAQRLHFLFQSASADLAQLSSFAAESELRRHLEALVARAYGEIHGTRKRRAWNTPLRWFTRDFPLAFRKHHRAFVISVLLTLAGALFGGFAMMLDPDAKEALLPGMFASSSGGRPSERVAREEEAKSDPLAGHHTSFAGQLMQNNITVSIRALAWGMLWGIGTAILLFYNGIIVGLVVVDYVADGQTIFLLGWLMPHGVIEIPAILIAGQAGLVLGHAVIGTGQRLDLAGRLRAVSRDVILLIQGVALLLVWAGIVESFLSQHHEPAVPYLAKISLGLVELSLLIWFLYFKRAAPSGATFEAADATSSGAAAQIAP